MSISAFSVQRPVTVVMIFAGLFTIGIISLNRIGQELFPEATLPAIVAFTPYPGVGPFEVESDVTVEIEDAVSGINGLEHINSTSREGLSTVRMNFASDTDIDMALIDVREALNAIEDTLPPRAERPQLFKFEGGLYPTLELNVLSSAEGMDVRRLVEDRVSPQIERVAGVAQVDLFGGREAAVMVRLNLDALGRHAVAVSEVLRAFEGENVTLPGGRMELGDYELSLRTIGEFESVADIEQVLVASRAGVPIFLGDLATIEMDFKPQQEFVRAADREGLRIEVHKQPGYNTVDVNDEVLGRLHILQRSLPPSLQIEVQVNQADQVRDSIGGVVNAAWQGGILAIFVLLVFLRNLRSTVIISLVIPVAVVSTFTLIDFGGMTLNITSLMGITLAIGMFVDNSIVVLESIYRKQLNGLDRFEAAVSGAEEVSTAITASTLTSMAVFLPMLYVEGIAGILFEDLSLTIAFSLFVSLAAAISLMPVLCSRFLRIDAAGLQTGADRQDAELSLADLEIESRSALLNSVAARVQRVLRALDDGYERLLEWALSNIAVVIVSAVLLLALSVASILLLGMEFLPEADEGSFVVNFRTRIDSSAAATARRVDEVESIIREESDGYIVALSSVIGGGAMLQGGGSGRGNNTATVHVRLADVQTRRRDIWSITNEIDRRIGRELMDLDYNVEIQGMAAIAQSASGVTSPLVVELTGDDFDELRRYGERVRQAVADVSGARNVRTDTRDGARELQLRLRRSEAVRRGLRPLEVAQTIRTAYHGSEVSRFSEQESRYDVWLMLREEDRNNRDALRSIFFRTPEGNRVPIENVVDFREDIAPDAIRRLDRVRNVNVLANLTGERALNRVMNDIQTRVEAMGEPPAGITVNFTGAAEEMQESFESLFFALLLAALLVYMVMASQFESFVDPLIVMFSVPFAIIGLVAALIITNSTFNILSFVGAILLVGLVVNNAIVLIDYMNILRRRGIDLRTAVIRGGKTRLKPVLMTSATTLLALLPMALGIGVGAELRYPIGRAVVGGLFSSTLITLALIPTLYYAIERFIERQRNRGDGDGNAAGATGSVAPRGFTNGLTVVLAGLGLLLAAPQSAAQQAAGGLETDRPYAVEFSVEDLEARALQDSDAARRGRLNVLQSEAAYRTARAERAPSVALRLSASRLGYSSESFELPAGAVTVIEPGEFGPSLPTQPIPIPAQPLDIDLDLPSTVYGATATLRQPVFTWGRISRSIEAARFEQQARQVELQQTEHELRLEVRELYFAARFAEESQVLLREMAELVDQVVADRRAGYQEGRLVAQAVLEAQALQAELSARLIEAEQSGGSAREGLAFYCRIDRPQASQLTSDFRSDVPELDQAELTQRAMLESPSLAALYLQARRAEAAAAAARAQRNLLPQVGLEFNLETTSRRLPAIEDRWREDADWEWRLTIAGELQLFDGGQSAGRIEQAELAAELAHSGAAEYSRSRALAVQRAVAAVRSADATRRRRAAEAAHADERARSARAAYQSETISREAKLTAELARIEAHAAVLESRYQLERALSELEYVIAGAL
ncbi:MAG: hypothetical protein EA404_14725 [Spirochaetaceae bacterium]|nr:MAG: hypothetical protein EA404_14725 [Spirochaetaceae bacterium]